MALVSEEGLSYLEQQAEGIAKNYGGRVGKSGVVRGIIDGLAQANIDLSSAPTPYHIAVIVNKLTTTNDTEVKS
jgi:hypothetical protein